MEQRKKEIPFAENCGLVEDLPLDELRRLYAELRAKHHDLQEEHERIRTEYIALQVMRDRFEDLFDYAPFGYVCLDESGKILAANLATAAMLDLERQLLIGNYLTSFMETDKRRSFYEIRQELMNSNRIQVGNFTLSRSDGSEINVRMSFMLIEDADNARQEIRIAILESTKAENTGSAIDISREKLLKLYRHMQFLREQEKYTFSRAIHDELSQVLAVLKMELSWVEENFDPEDLRVRQQFENLNKLLDHTIRASKHITSELRPYMLDELGLASAIKWAAKEFKIRTGIETELKLEAAPAEIESTRATAAFRIVQELLDNVERHANASGISISMRSEKGSLVLDFGDDGRGISRDQLLNAGSFGLMGIRERAYEFGGDVLITGEPDKGTRVIVRIPTESGEESAKTAN